MIIHFLISLILIYTSVVLQISCSNWIPRDWGTPQFLLPTMIYLVLRDKGDRAVLLSAGIGFLADSLEPYGMGRYFLLYSIAGWWIRRQVDSGTVRLTRFSILAFIAVNSILIPLAAIALGLMLKPSHPEHLPSATRVLLSGMWTIGISLPILPLHDPRTYRSTLSKSRSRSNHWNMLTNSQ